MFAFFVVFSIGNDFQFVKKLDTEVKNNPKEILKLMVPSLVYMIQNNLLYIALSHLDAATYTVLYQLKIFTTGWYDGICQSDHHLTRLNKYYPLLALCGVDPNLSISFIALFSIVILGRRLSTLKWLSLGVLSIGVITVEFSSKGASEDKNEANNHFWGVVCIMLAAITSGFAGVYFEAVLKGSRYVTSPQLFFDGRAAT